MFLLGREYKNAPSPHVNFLKFPPQHLLSPFHIQGMVGPAIWNC